MTIYDIAEMLDVNMELNYVPGRNPRWYCNMRGVETKTNKHSCILNGTCGDGNTPEEAILDYANKISEKYLIVDAYGFRKELKAVKGITA